MANTLEPAPLRIGTQAGELARAGSRLVVVAPHPDDELLGIGGTLRLLQRLGHAVLVVSVTDGESSHPGSLAWPPERLIEARQCEAVASWKLLGLEPTRIRLSFADGAVAAAETDLAESLASILEPGDTVFVPWRMDGHADHESCSRATRIAAAECGAVVHEFPVWALVPGHSAHAGLERLTMRCVALPADVQLAKRLAIAALHSQIGPDESTGALPVLPPHALAVWQQPDEWLVA